MSTRLFRSNTRPAPLAARPHCWSASREAGINSLGTRPCAGHLACFFFASAFLLLSAERPRRRKKRWTFLPPTLEGARDLHAARKRCYTIPIPKSLSSRCLGAASPLFFACLRASICAVSTAVRRRVLPRFVHVSGTASIVLSGVAVLYMSARLPFFSLLCAPISATLALKRLD